MANNSVTVTVTIVCNAELIPKNEFAFKQARRGYKRRAEFAPDCETVIKRYLEEVDMDVGVSPTPSPLSPCALDAALC